MGKTFLDQKVMARNFEARNQRTVTGTPAKSKKQRAFGQRRKEAGDCYQWKASGKCKKGDTHPLLLQNADEKRREDCLEGKITSRRQSVWEGISETVQGLP